jgi:hypothetical protein
LPLVPVVPSSQGATQTGCPQHVLAVQIEPGAQSAVLVHGDTESQPTATKLHRNAPSTDCKQAQLPEVPQRMGLPQPELTVHTEPPGDTAMALGIPSELSVGLT